MKIGHLVVSVDALQCLPDPVNGEAWGGAVVATKQSFHLIEVEKEPSCVYTEEDCFFYIRKDYNADCIIGMCASRCVDLLTY